MIQESFSFTEIMCSNQKKSGYVYKHKDEALNYKYIQFNAHALFDLIIDVDGKSMEDVDDLILEHNLPQPSYIVKTDNGAHIHWELKYPISYKKVHMLQWAREVLLALNYRLSGDKHAIAVKPHIYRNPIKHYTEWFGGKFVLSDFKEVKTSVKQELGYINTKNSKYKKVFVDFTQVERGERHQTLFHYLRYEGYSLQCKDALLYEAQRVNALMPHPISMNRIEGIVKSICTFVDNNYDGIALNRKEQIEHNKRVAKKRHNKTMTKILKTLKDNKVSSIRFMSGKNIADMCNVSQATISRYKDEIEEAL